MKNHKLFYGIFFGMFLLVFLAIPFAFGEDVTSRVTILGAAPSVGEITYSDNIALSTCGNVTVWCNATIMDTNGWNDIDTVNATLWDDVSANEGDADDNSTHYSNYSCVFDGSGSTAIANCSFTLQYYANATDWTCKVYARDTSNNVDSNSTSAVTVNTLRALEAEDSINFDSLAPGANSSEDVNNTVINCGNSAMDLNLSGTNLINATATVTNISVTNVKYNVTDWNQSYTYNMTSLTGGPVTRTEFSLAKRTNGVSNQTTYWKIGIPASIETLTYEGNVTFMAVADT